MPLAIMGSLVWGSVAVAQAPAVRRDLSLLTVVIDDARLIVIDANGARTGLDPDSRTQVNDIPLSQVTVDAIDDDVSGEGATSFTTTVRIDKPTAGVYRVILVGRGATTLIVSAWATDGRAQPELRVPVTLTAKGRTEFRIQFAPTPGGSPKLERIP